MGKDTKELPYPHFPHLSSFIFPLSSSMGGQEEVFGLAGDLDLPVIHFLSCITHTAALLQLPQQSQGLLWFAL